MVVFLGQKHLKLAWKERLLLKHLFCRDRHSDEISKQES